MKEKESVTASGKHYCAAMRNQFGQLWLGAADQTNSKGRAKHLFGSPSVFASKIGLPS
jgi:hypothetical protein